MNRFLEKISGVLAALIILGFAVWAIYFLFGDSQNNPKLATAAQVGGVAVMVATVLIMYAQNLLNKRTVDASEEGHKSAEESQGKLLELQRQLVKAQQKSANAIDATKALQEELVGMERKRFDAEMATLHQRVSEGFRQALRLAESSLQGAVAAGVRANDGLKALRVVTALVLVRRETALKKSYAQGPQTGGQADRFNALRQAVFMSYMGLNIPTSEVPSHEPLRKLVEQLAFNDEPKPEWASWEGLTKLAETTPADNFVASQAALHKLGVQLVDAACAHFHNTPLPSLIDGALKRLEESQEHSLKVIPKTESDAAKEVFWKASEDTIRTERNRLLEAVLNIVSVFNNPALAFGEKS